jgi:hypothetical protein
MSAVNKLPTSSIEEAQGLVRKCAEPRQACDQVNAAILRASRRLGFAFNRTRDMWYGDVRRVDAAEMDRLRRVAEDSEIARAIAGIEFLKNRMMVSRSPTSHQVIAGLNAALRALGRT